VVTTLQSETFSRSVYSILIKLDLILIWTWPHFCLTQVTMNSGLRSAFNLMNTFGGIMAQISTFKRQFFAGKTILLEGTRRESILDYCTRQLTSCGVRQEEVIHVNFIEWLERSPASFLVEQAPGPVVPRVWVVQGLGLFDPLKKQQFADKLRHFQRLFFLRSWHLVLISDVPNWASEIRSLLPRSEPIQVAFNRSEDADEKIHWAIELASQMAQKRILRLSETAAYYLEGVYQTALDEDLLQEVIEAVQRSSDGVLRRMDFLESKRRKKSPPDEALTCCN